MLILLRTLSILLGVSIVCIAMLHIALGPAAIPGAVPVNATMDSEDRFYATMFLAYGTALLWCARHLRQRLREFRLLMLVFFLGGLARIVSIVAVGLPNEFFLAMTFSELALPPLLVWLSFVVARGTDRAFGLEASRMDSRLKEKP